MNDFTKDELMELKYWLEHADDSVDAIDHYNLMNKLQSMINNYCEHESGYIDYDYNPIRCNACKEIVE